MKLRSVGKSFLLLLIVIGGLAVTAGNAGATFPGENGPMVFDEAGDNNTADLYTIQPDGTGKFKLTNAAPGIINFGGAFDNGSGRVTYVQFNIQEQQNSRIHVINVDGTGDTAISPADELDTMPSFSPDNNRIVFVRDNVEAQSYEIYTMKTDGSDTVKLTSDCCDALPVYSPDGTMIAFFRLDDLWLMNADGSNPHLVAEGAMPYRGRPSFSPDGARIAFESFPFETVDSFIDAGIHSVALDGSGRRLEVGYSGMNPPTGQNGSADAINPGGSPASPAWSPDGTSLGYLFQEGQIPGENPPYTPAGFGINISNLTTGQASLIAEGKGETGLLDWGNKVILPPQCKMRLTKARFFVFRRKPVYRLVARYWSEASGLVQIDFFAKNEDGSKGRPLGTVTHEFSGVGWFRIRKQVSRSQIKKLRQSKNGYIAEATIQEKPDYCAVADTLDLSQLEFVKKQFVWFQQD